MQSSILCVQCKIVLRFGSKRLPSTRWRMIRYSDNLPTRSDCSMGPMGDNPQPSVRFLLQQFSAVPKHNRSPSPIKQVWNLPGQTLSCHKVQCEICSKKISNGTIVNSTSTHVDFSTICICLKPLHCRCP